ncbi:MAG: DUF72 domain-containing protein [Chloroflexota bacterium]|nr:DUF72 domain-containing protein [Chloroflexota bacterium]
MALLVGTSGWQYRHWRETFYPRGLPQSRWLEHYAARFATVESNAAFYRLPERSTFEAWAQRTPADFVWAVKVSRYLTHVKRLADPVEPIARFVARAHGLGAKLGPALLQLPPGLRRDDERLSAALQEFPPGVRVAVEFRHGSWWHDDVRRILEEYRAALCWADRRGPVAPLWVTTDWGYLRFHGGRARPPSCYGRAALATWAARVAEHYRPASEVFVYFNNDGFACALRDARVFAQLAERADLRPTRVPPARDVKLGTG